MRSVVSDREVVPLNVYHIQLTDLDHYLHVVFTRS